MGPHWLGQPSKEGQGPEKAGMYGDGIPPQYSLCHMLDLSQARQAAPVPGPAEQAQVGTESNSPNQQRPVQVPLDIVNTGVEEGPSSTADQLDMVVECLQGL